MTSSSRLISRSRREHVAGQPGHHRHDAQADERRQEAQPQRPGDQHRRPLGGRRRRRARRPARDCSASSATPSASAPPEDADRRASRSSASHRSSAAVGRWRPGDGRIGAQRQQVGGPAQHRAKPRRRRRRRRGRGRRHRHPRGQAHREHVEAGRDGQRIAAARCANRARRRAGPGSGAAAHRRRARRDQQRHGQQHRGGRSCQQPIGDAVRPQQPRARPATTPDHQQPRHRRRHRAGSRTGCAPISSPEQHAEQRQARPGWPRWPVRPAMPASPARRTVAVRRCRAARRASASPSPGRGRRPVASTPRADPSARAPTSSRATRAQTGRHVGAQPGARGDRAQRRADRAVGFVGGDGERAHRMCADPQFADQRRPAPPSSAWPARARAGSGGDDASARSASHPAPPRRAPPARRQHHRDDDAHADDQRRAAHTGCAASPDQPREPARGEAVPPAAATANSSGRRPAFRSRPPRFDQQSVQLLSTALPAAVGVPRRDRADRARRRARRSTAISLSRRGPSRPRPTCSRTWTAAAS